MARVAPMLPPSREPGTLMANNYRAQPLHVNSGGSVAAVQDEAADEAMEQKCAPGDVTGTFAFEYALKVLANARVAYAASLSLQLLGVLLCVILFATGYQQAAHFPTHLPIISKGSLHNANGAFDAVSNVGSGLNMLAQRLQDQDERSISAAPTTILYASENNCLTRENLFSMKDFESRLVGLEPYREKLCLREGATCAKPTSVQRLFDGTYEALGVLDTNGDNIFRADPDFLRIGEIVDTAYDANGNSDKPSLKNAGQPQLREMMLSVLGSDFNQQRTATKTCRTVLQSGLPLPGYRNAAVDQQQQLDALVQLQLDIVKPYVSERTIVGDTSVSYGSDGTLAVETAAERSMDQYLMLGSALFAAVFMMVATESWWIGINFAVLCVGTTAWANFIYRVICDFRYFGEVNVCAIYIAPSTAAFSLLLFLYKFKSARHNDNPGKSTENKFATAFAEADQILLATHATMMFAYFVACITDIVIVQIFALNAGWLVFLSHLQFYVFVPAIVATAGTKSFSCEHKSGRRCVAHLDTGLSTSYVSRFIGHRALRWIVISSTLVLLVVFLIFSVVRLQVDRNQPVAWRPGSNFGQYEQLEAFSFAPTATGQSVQVTLVFGLDAAAANECHHTDVACTPSPKYNLAFDASSATVQRSLLAVCAKLTNLNLTQATALKVARSSDLDPVSKTGAYMVDCFMDGVDAFYEGSPAQLPFSTASMEEVMLNAYPGAFPAAAYPAASFNAPPEDNTFYRAFEVGLVAYMNEATPQEFARYSPLFGGVADESLRRSPNGTTLEYGGDFGDHLRYGAIRVTLSLNSKDISPAEADETVAAWDAYVLELSSDLPLPLKGLFQATPRHQTWSWLRTQASIVQAVALSQGLGVAAVFLLASLLLGNAAVAGFVAFHVAGAVVMLFGILAFAEWSLGVVEVTNVAFFVALTAQPIVMLGASYNQASAGDSIGRLRHAMADAGSAVLIGSFMPVGTALFLLGSRLYYTFQFGVLFLAAAAIGCIFSLVVLATVLGVFGPEHETGRLHKSRSTSSKKPGVDEAAV